MRMLINILLAGILILAQSGCSNQPLVKQSVKSLVSKVRVVDFRSSGNVKQGLYAQLKEWRGVDYKFGGVNKKGVDCSGFVYVTFNDRFGLTLPRTTKQQVKVGPAISRADLRAGDLVFFKTGFFKYHVGIYVESRRFIHASESVGVTMSNMDNPYWLKHYWKSVRPSE